MDPYHFYMPNMLERLSAMQITNLKMGKKIIHQKWEKIALIATDILPKLSEQCLTKTLAIMYQS